MCSRCFEMTYKLSWLSANFTPNILIHHIMQSAILNWHYFITNYWQIYPCVWGNMCHMTYDTLCNIYKAFTENLPINQENAINWILSNMKYMTIANITTFILLGPDLIFLICCDKMFSVMHNILTKCDQISMINWTISNKIHFISTGNHLALNWYVYQIVDK